MPQPSKRELLDGFTRIASRAAAAILAIPRADINPSTKADHSPVTAADHASEAAILEGLAAILPDFPVISEESANKVAPAGHFLLVDPLDGTREFIAGLDEYTVNIALIEDAVPVAGVISAPARGLLWRGCAGLGAERLALSAGADIEAARARVAIHTRARAATGPRVLLSRSHPEAATLAYLDRLDRPERVPCGSSLKFCLIAEGSADLCPRYARLSEWDVAAGHALLLAAGGGIVSTGGAPLRYGNDDFRLPPFIAFGDPAPLPGL
jgi:3'(2'), 5'-bisphosphate nucleotidase